MKHYRPFLLLFCLFIAFSNTVMAQQTDSITETVKKHPFHIRFFTGVGFFGYSLSTKDGYQQMVFPKSVYSHNDHYDGVGFSWAEFSDFRITDVKAIECPGLSIGFALEMQIGKKVDFQVVPTLTLASLRIQYKTELLNQAGQVFESKMVNSDEQLVAFVELPLLVKYRPMNNSFYLLGGLNPQYKLASRKNGWNPEIPVVLLTNRFGMSLDFGCGYHFYKRLGVQVKMSLGLINLVKGLEEQVVGMSFYNLPIQSARWNQMQIAFLF